MAQASGKKLKHTGPAEKEKEASVPQSAPINSRLTVVVQSTIPFGLGQNALALPRVLLTPGTPPTNPPAASSRWINLSRAVDSNSQISRNEQRVKMAKAVKVLTSKNWYSRHKSTKAIRIFDINVGSNPIPRIFFF